MTHEYWNKYGCTIEQCNKLRLLDFWNWAEKNEGCPLIWVNGTIFKMPEHGYNFDFTLGVEPAPLKAQALDFFRYLGDKFYVQHYPNGHLVVILDEFFFPIEEFSAPTHHEAESALIDYLIRKHNPGSTSEK